MAQKSPILLHAEAESALINTVNYFIQQGVPVYEMKSIVDVLKRDLDILVEREVKAAEEEYQKAAAEEEANADETVENE